MALRKSYPTQTTTLYSNKPSANTGGDAILEVGSRRPFKNSNEVTRSLLQFSTDELKEVYSNTSEAKTSYLKLYTAHSTEIPPSYTLEVHPIAQPWTEGKGKYGVFPIDTSGASWTYSSPGDVIDWEVNPFPTNTTGSFIEGNEGGGIWIQGLGIENQKVWGDSLDPTVDVTSLVDGIVNDSFINNGFLLKLKDDFNLQVRNFSLKYYSRDTNTIYSPEIITYWDDSVYDDSLYLINTPNVHVTLINNKGTYRTSDKVRWRLHIRPQNPTRIFSTSSIYKVNNRLSEQTYWAITDEHVKRTVIDFNTIGTKVSCDSESMYIDFPFYNLKPGRYYRLWIRSFIDGTFQTIDTGAVFKVTSYD